MRRFTKLLGWLLLLGCFFTSNDASAQALTNGQDFWFGLLDNTYIDPGGLRAYVSSPVNTTATADVPGLAFTLTLPVAANSTTQFVLPDAAECNSSQVIENLGVHVTAPTDVYVFGLNYGAYTADASLVLPTPTLGRDYIVLAGGDLLGSTEFMIVATQNGTVVEITPSNTTAAGNAAGVPFTVTLN